MSIDNLPGPKTAAQWINKYDGLDNLSWPGLARPGGKRGAALREHTMTWCETA